MHRYAIPCAVLFVSLQALGCATEVVSAPDAPLAGVAVCSGGLCIDETGQQSLSEANAALTTCVPDDGMTAGDPAGLRISDVALAGHDGDHYTVRVVLANVLPSGVMTYPGTTLSVASGSGTVLDPMAGQLYGIFGCTTNEASFTVEWDGSAPLELRAAAINDLGESIEDEVAFTLTPPG